MKGKQAKSRKSSKRAQTARANPPVSAVNYRGPVTTSLDRLQDSSIVRVLCYQGNIGSSVGGIISLYLNNSPLASTDFPSYANLYEEYRVLAAELIYQPYYQNYSSTGSAGQNQSALAYGISRDVTTGPPGSFAAVMSLPSSHMVSSQDHWSITGKMDGTAEALFVATSSPAPSFGFVIYASALSASINYSFYVMRLRVQFRSPK